MTETRLSVVIPARNEEALIGEVLEAILASVARASGVSRKDLWLPDTAFEVVVVDDGSEDATAAIVGLFADDVGVRLVPCVGRTCAAARNVGTAASSGQVLCFVDADTIVPENAVERILELHSPAGSARGEASIIEEALMVVPIGRAGQWPLFGDRAGLVEGTVALEVRPVTAHERRHRLGPRQREASRQSPEAPPEPGSNPGLPGGEPIEHQAPALVLVEFQDAVDGFLRNDGVRVDEADRKSVV